MNWYIERIFPVERRLVRTIRPLLSRLTSMPIADDRIFAAVERLHRNLDGVRQLLTNERMSSIRLVVNPEKMVIAEARRTYTYLSLFGYRVDAVIVNRIIPDEVKDPYFGKWKEIQAEHLATIHESFQPVPILPARLFDREMVGIALLRSWGRRSTANATPRTSCTRRADPRAQARERVRAVDAAAVRRSVGPRRVPQGRGAVRARRALQAEPLLPQVLQRLEIQEASFVEDRLEVRFAKPAAPDAGGGSEEEGEEASG